MTERDGPLSFTVLDVRTQGRLIPALLARRPRPAWVVLRDASRDPPRYLVLTFREFSSFFAARQGFGPGDLFQVMPASARKLLRRLVWIPEALDRSRTDPRGNRVHFDGHGVVVAITPEDTGESSRRAIVRSAVASAFDLDVETLPPPERGQDDEGVQPIRYPSMVSEAPLAIGERCTFVIDLFRSAADPSSTAIAFETQDERWAELDVDVTLQSLAIEFDDARPLRIKVRRNLSSVSARVAGRILETSARDASIEVVAQFWTGVRFCGSALFKFAFGSGSPGAGKGVVAPSPAAREPDLTICIYRESASTLHWQMRVAAFPGRPPKLNGRVTLDPAFSEDVLKSIQAFPLLEPGRHLPAVQAFGDRLWEAAPSEFRDVYWATSDHLQRSLAIQFVTEDPQIPWELMRPSRGDEVQDLLTTRHAVARWLADYEGAMTNRLPQGELVIVAPKYKSASSERNATQEAVEKLLTDYGARRVVGTREALLAELESPSVASMRLLYFAGHGAFDPDTSTAVLELEGGGQLTATEVDRKEVVLGQRHGPIVFLSACEVANSGRSLGQVTGWAKSFLSRRFGAFLAPLWAIEENDAQEVTSMFFDLAIRRGLPLGEVLRSIKQQGAIKSTTCFAYLLYGDVTASF